MTPFIVELSAPVEELRADLADVDQAELLRELPGGQVVVIAPKGAGRQIEALDSVASVTVDTLEQPDG